MRGKSGSRLNFVAFDKVLALLRDLEPSDDRPTQMDYRYYRKLQELAFCTWSPTPQCSEPDAIEAFSTEKLALLRSYLPFGLGRID